MTLTMSQRATLARFGGDRDKTERYCLSMIQEYLDTIDAVKASANPAPKKSEAAHV